MESLRHILMISILSGRSLVSSFISRMTVFLAYLSNSYIWCFWIFLKIIRYWVTILSVYPPNFGSRRVHGITFSMSARLSPTLIKPIITFVGWDFLFLSSCLEVWWDFLIRFIRFSFLARFYKNYKNSVKWDTNLNIKPI